MSHVITFAKNGGGNDNAQRQSSAGRVRSGSTVMPTPSAGAEDQDNAPGKQRAFYRHVSGAGDGHALQTTATTFKPAAKGIMGHVAFAEEDNDGNTIISPPDVNVATTQTANTNIEDRHKLDVDWQDKIQSLQDQIMALLLQVDQEKVDVHIGRTTIQRDKAVVLAWNKSQHMHIAEGLDPQKPDIIADESHSNNEAPVTTAPTASGVPVVDNEEAKDDEDGVLLYLAVKFKDQYGRGPEDEAAKRMRRLFRNNDFNNNPEEEVGESDAEAAGGLSESAAAAAAAAAKRRKASSKFKKTVRKTVRNEAGELVEIEVVVNRRKVTRKVVDEETGDVMEVETDVSTDDSTVSDLDEDGERAERRQRRMRRGKTGATAKKEDQVEKEEASDRRQLEPQTPQRTRRTRRKTEAGDAYDDEEFYQHDDAEVVDIDGQELDDEKRRAQRKSRISRGGQDAAAAAIRGRQSRADQLKYRRRFCQHGRGPEFRPDEDRTRRSRRTKSLGDEGYDDEDYYDDEGYGVNYWRHDYCFEPFNGYGDDYDGPKGILTSFLPDGSSTLLHEMDSFAHRAITSNLNDEPQPFGSKRGPPFSRSFPSGENEESSTKRLYTRAMSKVSTIPEEDDSQQSVGDMMHQMDKKHSLGTCSEPTVDLSPLNVRPLARAVQVPNRIRRLRSRHVRSQKNLWFIGSTEKSFNSRCSSRFDTKDLEEDAMHYYYYRSLPRITQEASGYVPSITSSIDNIEVPKLPSVVKRPDDLLL